MGDDECLISLNGAYEMWYFKKGTLPGINFGTYTYSAVPKCFTPLSQQALAASGILAIRSQPNLALTGDGVLIGIVDTGIDYQDPAFRYEDGSSRIVAIWDQTVEDGTPPENYFYGQEYTAEDINAALATDQPLELVPENDPSGHGTALAGIAAGSADAAGTFSGAAPYAALAVVKLKEAKPYLRNFYFIPEGAAAYQENDIMTGVDYLNQLAVERNQPLVLLIGLGTNNGAHSGDTYLSSFLDDIGQRRRRAVVVAGGNEANARHHYYGKLYDADQIDTVEINVEKNMRGFQVEMWSRSPELYEIAVISPSGERLSRVPVERQSRKEYSFVLEGTTLTVDYRIVGSRSANQLIYLRFEKPTRGVWKILVYSRNYVYGTFHMWLPISAFLEAPVYFLSSSPDITLTVPGTASVPMTVGGYNDQNGSLYLDSGRGYTIEGDIKPDFVAPAVEVEGPDDLTHTGTSAAAAITAGAAAMFLEWAVVRGNLPSANTADVKAEFIRGASQSVGELYPNREWGYGMLDLSKTFLKLAGIS
jgi:subtilisin family serine protease